MLPRRKAELMATNSIYVGEEAGNLNLGNAEVMSTANKIATRANDFRQFWGLIVPNCIQKLVQEGLCCNCAGFLTDDICRAGAVSARKSKNKRSSLLEKDLENYIRYAKISTEPHPREASPVEVLPRYASQGTRSWWGRSKAENIIDRNLETCKNKTLTVSTTYNTSGMTNYKIL